jgi:hypothetical protein
VLYIHFKDRRLLYTVSTEVVVDCPMEFRWEVLMLEYSNKQI